MDLNPISLEAIGWFFWLNHIDHKVWEAQALERIDNAVCRAWRADRPKPTPRGGRRESDDGQIPVSNPKGIGVMLRGLAARVKQRMAAKEEEGETDG